MRLPFLVLSLLAWAPGARAGPPSSFQLRVGGQLLREGRLVSVDRPQTLEARVVAPGVVSLTGRAPGVATVVVVAGKETVRWQVTVVPFDAARAAAELRALMPPVAGLLVGHDRACMWAECPDCTEAQRATVEAVLALYPCVVTHDPISPGRPAHEVVEATRALLGEGPAQTPELTLEVRGGRALLRGQVRTADEARLVEQARAAFPELVVHVVGP